MKEVYVLIEKSEVVIKIVNVYKREDRANSMRTLLNSQYPDKKYVVELHNVL